MKKKIIVTRDKDAYNSETECCIWRPGANPMLGETGVWCGRPWGYVGMKACDFRRVFGFLPRKGSKAVYVLRKEGDSQ